MGQKQSEDSLPNSERDVYICSLSTAAPSVEIYGTLDWIVFFPQRNASILVAGHPNVCHCVISIQDWKGFLFEGGGYAFPLFNMLHFFMPVACY